MKHGLNGPKKKQALRHRRPFRPLAMRKIIKGNKKHKRTTDMTHKFIEAHTTHTQAQHSITKMHEGLNRQPE